MKEKFTLKHVVLYAKGWYKRQPNFLDNEKENIWEDLQKLLEMDDYLMWEERPDKERLTNLILTQFERLNNTDKSSRRLPTVFEGIKKNNVTRCGYYTKGCWCEDDVKRKNKVDELPDYDINEAIVRYCLSEFSNIDRTEWSVVHPDFEKFPSSLTGTPEELKIKI